MKIYLLCVLLLVLVNFAFGQERAGLPFVTKPLSEDMRISKEDASLLKASAEGDVTVVKESLSQRANIEARDYKSGNTPIIWASFNGHVKVMKILMEKGANIDALSDDGHKTALLFAAYNGHVEAVELLLQKGARVNQANARGDTSIALASFMNRAAVVDALLLRLADVTLRSHELQLTPLHLAAHKGHVGILEKLLAEGVQAKTVVNAQDRDGNTAFMLAAQHNRTRAVEALLARAPGPGILVELNHRDREGNSALALAVDRGHVGIVELLLQDERMDLDTQNRAGQSLLVLAAQKGRVEIFRQLLQAGANPHMRDKKGRKAWHMAREAKCTVCTELLREYYRLEGRAVEAEEVASTDEEDL